MTEREPPESRPIHPHRSSARLRLRSGGQVEFDLPPKKYEEPEKKDANRVARLGLVVSLVVAVLSAIVTVVVTFVGANNSREQSAEEFRRGQRQAIYTDFITAANEAHERSVFLTEIRGVPGQHDEKVNTSAQEAYDAQVKLGQKFDLVRLVGTSAAVGAATNVSDEMHKLAGLLQYPIPPDDPAPGQPGSRRSAIYYSQQNVLDFLNNFIVMARADLGTRD
jgi:hypothetical protein